MYQTTSQFTGMRRRVFLQGATGAAALVALSGCTSAVSQKASPTSGAPKKGGVLKLVQEADINTVSIMGQNNPNFSVNRTIFNYLTYYDHKTLQPKPELATSWKMSADDTSITLNLRKGVKYHNGRPFTAADVIGSLKVMQRPTTSSQTAHVAAIITDMTPHGDHEVTIKLAHPVSNLFDLFDMMPIIDPTTVDQLFAGTTFNGTGPFKVDSRKPGVDLKLSRNTHYWKPGLPYLDGIDITIVKDSQSMLSSLKAGQSQLALDLAPLDASSLTNNPDYSLVVSDAHDSTFYIASNTAFPLLSNKAVRQGIAYSIDRERMLTQVLGKIGSTTSLPWSPASPAYDKSKIHHYTYNPAKAKSIITGAGVAGQQINVYYDTGFPPNVGLTEIAVFNLKAAGLNAVSAPQQTNTFHQNLIHGGFKGVFVHGHGFGQLHPATLVKGAFPFNADNNSEQFNNQEYKDLAQSLWTETDPAKQKAVINKVNDFFLDQQFVSDLVNSSHTYSISNKLHNMTWTMLDYINLDNAYLS